MIKNPCYEPLWHVAGSTLIIVTIIGIMLLIVAKIVIYIVKQMDGDEDGNC